MRRARARTMPTWICVVPRRRRAQLAARLSRLWPSGLHADDEDAARGARAADVERGEAARALDLVGAGLPARLQVGVEHLAHARGAHRMAAADEPARRVDRQLAAERDHALLHRLPRLARLGQAEVVDGHVLGCGE